LRSVVTAHEKKLITTTENGKKTKSTHKSPWAAACAKKWASILIFGPKRAIPVPHHLILSPLDQSLALEHGELCVVAPPHPITGTMLFQTEIEIAPCGDDLQ
jgi:hypothetical protein